MRARQSRHRHNIVSSGAIGPRCPLTSSKRCKKAIRAAGAYPAAHAPHRRAALPPPPTSAAVHAAAPSDRQVVDRCPCSCLQPTTTAWPLGSFTHGVHSASEGKGSDHLPACEQAHAARHASAAAWGQHGHTAAALFNCRQCKLQRLGHCAASCALCGQAGSHQVRPPATAVWWPVAAPQLLPAGCPSR